MNIFSCEKERKSWQYSLREFDALPASRLVAVAVFAAAGSVLDPRARHVHRIGALAVIGQAAGPFDRVFVIVLVPTGPDAETKVHRGLREILAVVGVLARQGADRAAIDDPLQFVGGPDDGVVVEVVLQRLGNGVVDGPVVGGGVALAEVVGLDVGDVAAEDLPVDFVEIVGLEHDAADDALAAGGFGNDLDNAEEEVEVGLDGRSDTLFGNGEFGAG